MYDKVQKIIDEVGMYTEGKYAEELFELNNYIIDHTVYDQEVVDKDISKTMSRKAYGVLINGKGIYSSYARAFQLVARMASFICVTDAGIVAISRDKIIREIKTGAHVWNMVCIQGNEWLMVDLTFNDYDDPGGNTGSSSWKHDGYSWWYQRSDGSYLQSTQAKINGVWYLFDNSGYAVTGWVNDVVKWYWMHDSEAMEVNTWITDKGLSYYISYDGVWVLEW
jgi:lysozyme